jgi:hypothetical protein
MLWWVREWSRSSSPSQLWVAGPLSPYNVIIYLFCIELLLYSKDVTFDPVPWFIICVRLGPSTPGDYVRARVLVPLKPGCDSWPRPLFFEGWPHPPFFKNIFDPDSGSLNQTRVKLKWSIPSLFILPRPSIQTHPKSRPLYSNTYIRDIFYFYFLYIHICHTLKYIVHILVLLNCYLKYSNR